MHERGGVTFESNMPRWVLGWTVLGIGALDDGADRDRARTSASSFTAMC